MDRFNNRARQTDVIIANEHHPFTFSVNKSGLFFIEGVSAVGGVKSSLTKKEIRTTIEKAVQFKKLTAILPRNAIAILDSGGGEGYLVHPPYFLFSFESRLRLDTVLKLLREDCGGNDTVDAIFLLDKGAIINLRTGVDGFVVRNPKQEKVIADGRP